MKSLLKRSVGAVYKKIDRINDLLNGPDPRFVSYRENGKDKKIEKLSLDASHCHSFIGKMKLDGTGTYSDEVMIAMIKFFFDHTPKGEKIVIELANKVSEYLNGEDSFQDSMTFEVQKNHLLELARSLSKKRTKDIEIISIEDNNKRLFEVLKNEGISGLDIASAPSKRVQGFDSLDIARHLYSVAKTSPQYMAEIVSLKSEEMRQVSGDSDYYGMIEMAIRINALLHGITLQGGVARQKKYDALLLKHINPYAKDILGLSELQNFCSEKLKSTSFQGLYFDTKESEKVVTKIDALKALGNKTRNALLLTLGLGVGIGATTVVNNSIQRTKQKEIVSESIKDIFQSKKVVSSGEMSAYEYTGKGKLEKIEEYKRNIFNRFVFRYGSIGTFSESAFMDKITDCLNNQLVLDELGNGLRSEADIVEDYVIDEYLIPRYKSEFSINGVSVLPYERFMPYLDNFINSMKYPEHIGALGIEKKIGEYSLKHDGGYGLAISRYELYLSNKDENGKQYVLASERYFEGYDKPVIKVDNKNMGEISLDFLHQRFPVLNTILDQYLYRYYEYENSHSYTINGPAKRIIPGEIEVMMVKDFVTSGLLQQYPEKLPIELLNEYVDRFVCCNKENIKKYSGDINKDVLPNGFLQGYEDAMENTIKNKKILTETYGRLPVSMYSNVGIYVEHIGKYKATDGDIFNVGYVVIEGKKYLYADNITFIMYRGDVSYSIYEGEKVAEDYFATKKHIESLNFDK